MLPRSKRLSVPLFTNAIANGKIVHSTFFTARMVKAAGPSRFSAVVSKKIAKTAVERNKFRRRIYSSIGGLPIENGFHVILLAKPALLKSSINDLKGDIHNFFVKSGLIK